MYTDASTVIHELGRRRKSKTLADEVLSYLGGNLPEGWPDYPVATLNRYLATARFEDIVFAHAAASLPIRPFWLTYHKEKFSSTNPEKISCLRPRVHQPQLRFSRRWLVSSHSDYEGMAIGSIDVNGRSLQQVHDLARREVISPDVVDNVIDVSAWNHLQVERFGGSVNEMRLAPHYYNAVMALYVYHGVLFEDFDSGPNQKSGLGTFVDDVVKPAIRNVHDCFSLQPLIVRLPYTPGFLNFPAQCEEVFNLAVRVT